MNINASVKPQIVVENEQPYVVGTGQDCLADYLMKFSRFVTDCDNPVAIVESCGKHEEIPVPEIADLKRAAFIGVHLSAVRVGTRRVHGKTFRWLNRYGNRRRERFWPAPNRNDERKYSSGKRQSGACGGDHIGTHEADSSCCVCALTDSVGEVA